MEKTFLVNGKKIYLNTTEAMVLYTQDMTSVITLLKVIQQHTNDPVLSLTNVVNFRIPKKKQPVISKEESLVVQNTKPFGYVNL